MKNKENAANRDSYVGKIYSLGEQKYKSEVLDSLPQTWADLHKNGFIHIHDLDAYGITYNCLTFDFLKGFPFSEFEQLNSNEEKIVRYFDYLKELFEQVGNEQSGGMALANFDIDTDLIFEKLKVNLADYQTLFDSCMYSFILWCNNMHTRMGLTSYYITLNIGLGTNPNAKLVSRSLLNMYARNCPLTIKPNIVFKVKKGISLDKDDPNYDLLLKSIAITNKKMIPTYLICDCQLDKNIDPKHLSVVGCRSRIVADLFGESNTIGRGNITNISINIVRIALLLKQSQQLNKENFLAKLDEIMDIVKDILLDRFHKTCNSPKELFEVLFKYQLIKGDDQNLVDVFKHGTLSIGFIGLSETVTMITNHKYWQDDQSYKLALDIVKHMREYCDQLVQKYHYNFSLLAPSGELISSRFLEYDQTISHEDFMDKGFYTNSFHVEVDSNLAAYQKINYEGKFHQYCNGGSITYVELKEAPNENIEGIYELIQYSVTSGVRYLGFNFPRDYCNVCHQEGLFNDCCDYCQATEITRIRRVSGYLEIQDYFTKGKYHESQTRKQN